MDMPTPKSGDTGPMNEEDPKMFIVARFGSHARLRSNALKAPHGSFKSQMYELASIEPAFE